LVVVFESRKRELRRGAHRERVDRQAVVSRKRRALRQGRADIGTHRAVAVRADRQSMARRRDAEATATGAARDQRIGHGWLRGNQLSEVTGTAAPCTARAASDARNTMTLARSEGATHFAGSALGIAARFSGVSMIVGSTQFTLMFF